MSFIYFDFKVFEKVNYDFILEHVKKIAEISAKTHLLAEVLRFYAFFILYFISLYILYMYIILMINKLSTDTLTDRQYDRQRYRWKKIDRQRYIQTEIQTDKDTYRQIYRRTKIHTDRDTDGPCCSLRSFATSDFV